MNSIGVVVIGRNEGSRLKLSLQSVINEQTTVVYVDSGSTDDSVNLAHSLGVNVVSLDMSIPFTAARARNAGFFHLLEIKPNIEFVQFVDGDCELIEGWLKSAEAEFIAQSNVVAVCGKLRERYPERSIYNTLCNIEWDTPVGETASCGGIAMMRVSAFKQVGGFNPNLIAGEEPELCVRLRQERGTILRINTDMAWHDADITRFSQWWKREIRNGYAYAQGMWLHGSSRDRHWVRESFRAWFWALLLPLITIIGLLPTRGLSLLFLAIAYISLGIRVYFLAKNKGFNSKDARYYGIFSGVIEKYPKLLGQIQFFISKLLKRQRTIIEYKNTASAN